MRQKRRTFSKLAILLGPSLPVGLTHRAVFIAILLVHGCCVGHLGAAESRNPNVVFFLVDDLGPDELACYASKFHETPNIGALAKSGVRFGRFYT